MTARDVVGIHHVAINVHVGNVVRSAAVVSTTDVHPGLERPIRTAVEDHADLVRQDPSIPGHARLQRDQGRMTRVPGHQLLNVVHDHFDWSAGVQRQVIAQGHIHERAFAAKVAPNAGGIHVDLFCGQAPHGRQLLSQHKGAFVVGPHLRPAVVVDVYHTGVRLNVALVHQLRPEGMLKDAVRRAKTLGNVTLRPAIVGEHIIDRGHRLGQSLVGRHLWVQRRG